MAKTKEDTPTTSQSPKQTQLTSMQNVKVGCKLRAELTWSCTLLVTGDENGGPLE